MQDQTGIVTEQESIEKKDPPLFEFFSETDPELLKRFTPSVSKEEQLAFFYSDFSFNPQITYPALVEDGDDLDSKKSSFIEKAPFLAQAFIDSRDLSVNEREDLLSYYRDLLRKRSMTFDLLSASKEGNYEEVDKLTEKIYGNPSVEIFNTYLTSFKKEMDSEAQNPLLSDLVTNLREVLPMESGKALDAKDIDLEPFRVYLQSLMQPIIESLAQYQNEEELDSSVINNTFITALGEIEADDWETQLSDEYKTITVKGNFKKIYIPNEKKVSKLDLLGLVAHEIFTHIQRRKLSEEIFPYEILEVGLNGYLEAEEAIATFAEAAYNTDKKIDLDGGDMHFGTCLALGLDGKKRDFKDVFKILYLTKKFNNIKNGKGVDIAEEKAKDSAWKTTLRIFRGTPGNIPGCCFRKDIVYGEGRLQLINYLHERPASNISDLWKAKYAPWNEEHQRIISKYK